MLPRKGSKIANIKGTPVFILTLINIHVFPKVDLSSESAKQVIQYCMNEKLITPAGQPANGPMYRLTPRGLAFLKMLEDTPLPQIMEVYADPRTGDQVGTFINTPAHDDEDDEDGE